MPTGGSNEIIGPSASDTTRCSALVRYRQPSGSVEPLRKFGSTFNCAKQKQVISLTEGRRHFLSRALALEFLFVAA
jgi:hypothetical protein